MGELSAAWDVAAPTLAETPGHLAAAVERLRAQQRVASPAQAPAPRADTATTAPASPARAAQAELGQAAADLAELDDHWFARAQARVRRALVAAGARLELGDDIFWIPLEDAVTAAAAGAVNVDSARAQAGAARAAHRRASAWRMPASVGCGVPAVSARWHGVGCGGVVRGRVRQVSELWRLWDGTSMLPAAMTPVVAVVPAVTPALAVALVGAAAIVSETGGLLDHGAAMARELGIPCVVGCTDAMSLPPHALVEVDGEAGVVRVLDES